MEVDVIEKVEEELVSDENVESRYISSEKKKPKRTKKPRKEKEIKPVIEEEPEKVDVKSIILEKASEVETLIAAISTGSYKIALRSAKELKDLINKLL